MCLHIRVRELLEKARSSDLAFSVSRDISTPRDRFSSGSCSGTGSGWCSKLIAWFSAMLVVAFFVTGGVVELELFLEVRTQQVEDLSWHLDATVEFFHLSFEPFHRYGW